MIVLSCWEQDARSLIRVYGNRLACGPAGCVRQALRAGTESQSCQPTERKRLRFSSDARILEPPQ